MANIPDNMLEDICNITNNCIDCDRHCCPRQHMNLIAESETGFYLEPYSDKLNTAIIHIAEEYGYQAGIIQDNGDTWIEIQKNP